MSKVAFDMLMGALAGGFIGWVGFNVLERKVNQRLRRSLMLGVGGGAAGVLLAPFINEAPTLHGQLDLFVIVVAAACASAFVVMHDLLTRHRDA